jgi:hypothetical protein
VMLTLVMMRVRPGDAGRGGQAIFILIRSALLCSASQKPYLQESDDLPVSMKRKPWSSQLQAWRVTMALGLLAFNDGRVFDIQRGCGALAADVEQKGRPKMRHLPASDPRPGVTGACGCSRASRSIKVLTSSVGDGDYLTFRALA